MNKEEEKRQNKVKCGKFSVRTGKFVICFCVSSVFFSVSRKNLKENKSRKGKIFGLIASFQSSDK